MQSSDLQERAELEAAKLQMQRREESLAAAQRQRQKDMNLRLLGQFCAVVALGALLAAWHFF
jgi:hypothetical protein